MNRFGFKVDTSVSSTNFVGRKLKKRLLIVGFIAIFVDHISCLRQCICTLVIFLSSPYEEISFISRSLFFSCRWVLDFQEQARRSMGTTLFVLHCDWIQLSRLWCSKSPSFSDARTLFRGHSLQLFSPLCRNVFVCFSVSQLF